MYGLAVPDTNIDLLKYPGSDKISLGKHGASFCVGFLNVAVGFYETFILP